MCNVMDYVTKIWNQLTDSNLQVIYPALSIGLSLESHAKSEEEDNFFT